MVGKKIDALAYPAGTRHIARQVEQTPKLAAAVRVTPEIPGGPPAIALPARRLADIAPDDHRLAGTIGDGIRHAYRQQASLAPLRRDGVEHVLAIVCAPGCTGKEDRIARRRPTGYIGDPLIG